MRFLLGYRPPSIRGTRRWPLLERSDTRALRVDRASSVLEELEPWHVKHAEVGTENPGSGKLKFRSGIQCVIPNWSVVIVSCGEASEIAPEVSQLEGYRRIRLAAPLTVLNICLLAVG